MSTKAKHNISEFDGLYRQLNDEQKKAVDAIEGPVMVIAGPGTGKTTILTLRIANILRKTDTAPENILALTFTESGAFAMRKKLLSIIGAAAYKVNIHTFHGFAEKVIQQYPDYFPRIIGSTVISDAEQYKIIEKIIRSKEIAVLRPYGDPAHYVRPVLSEIHILKRENVSPRELKNSIGKDVAAWRSNFPDYRDGETKGKLAQPKGRASADLKKTDLEKLEKQNKKNLELAHIYKEYEEELARQRYYDFDDMLLEIIRAMEENDSFKLMLQETYQYILADEHQDANASQNRVLELLSDFHDSPNLFIVGDDRQAIYRFQGASLENFLYFTKKHSEAVVIDLTHNYRSHQGILDASHSVISNNPGIPGRERARLLSLQMGSKPTYVNEFETKSDEIEYLAIVIEKLISKGEKPEEIAILYRENKQAAPISSSLRLRGISHKVESDRNILEDIDASKIILLLRAIDAPHDSEALSRALLLRELGTDPAPLTELFRLATREGKELYQIIESSKDKKARSAYARIVDWSRDAAELPFPEFLEKVVREARFIESIMRSSASLERLSSLEEFFAKAIKASESKKAFHLSDFIEYADIVSDHGLMSKRTYADHLEGVRLMTAHRSKGLEFNHVFIVHAIDGVWGNKSKRNLFDIPVIAHARDMGRIEDERRIFYVSMTRARESINISFFRRDGEREALPCMFIGEIDPALVTHEKVDVAHLGESITKKLRSGTKHKGLSLLDPGFVRSKFLSQPLSVTHLNNFLDCPWKFFFMNLIRIPQAQTKHQMYGTAVHAALKAFFDAYKDERDLTKKRLVDIFLHHLGNMPLSTQDRKESEIKGKKALSGYYEAYNKTWQRRLLTEYAIRGVGLPLRSGVKIELTGKLDKVEFIDDDSAIVVDFKTAKPKSRNEIEGKTKAGDGAYKRQLVFYKLLSEAERKFSMRYGEIDFVEPNERGIYKKERFEIDRGEVDELKETIERAAEEIMDLSFVNSGCGERDCSYCRLGDMLRTG